MTIRIKCPHCHKALGVKDHLAGKKVACPVCKKGLKIPAPVSTGADVEALAASALADAPKPVEPPKQSKPIAFTCPFCDAEVSVPYELGGKQTPCPECKRIIKVPKPVEDKPKDWRTVDRQGPSFARQNEPQAPDGAWAPAAAKRVSLQALEEAGALPEVKAEPIGVRGWIRRGIYAAAGLVVLWLVWTFLPSFKGESQGLTRALAFIEPESKLAPEATAALHGAAGAYYAHKEKPDVKKSLDHFGKARALLSQLPKEGPKTIDRDALLWDLALSWIDLVGAGKGVEGSTTFDWNQAQGELTRTLEQIGSSEARSLALRDVISRLLAKGGEGEQTASYLALQVEGMGPPADATKENAKPHQVQQVALLIREGKPDDASALIPRPKEDEITELAPRLAYAQGLARQGKFDEARMFAEKKGPPLHSLEALLGVAAIALGDTSAIDRARPMLDKAYEIAANEVKQRRKISPWDLIELGRLAACAGMGERVQQVLALLPDDAARGRIKLEQCREQCRVQGEQAPAFIDPAGAALPEKDSISRGLALEAFSRHNTRAGKSSAVLESVDNTEENLRPFILIGVALGEVDARRH